MKWDASAYAANSTVQQNWARELIKKLNLCGNENILDVGCGDGKITAELARAVPHGNVLGVDASAEMITFAEANFPLQKFPNLHFKIVDARKIKADKKFDLVFSNAALHWVNDHEGVLRGASSALKSGGQLLISCGGKGNAHEVFLALRPEMRLKRWRQFFRKMPLPYFFYAPSDYEKWLPKYGFKINSLQLAPKTVSYASAADFAMWLRTTWLPFTQRVPEKMQEEFISAVTLRYLAKHLPDATGNIHVRMVRLEIDAIKI